MVSCAPCHIPPAPSSIITRAHPSSSSTSGATPSTPPPPLLPAPPLNPSSSSRSQNLTMPATQVQCEWYRKKLDGKMIYICAGRNYIPTNKDVGFQLIFMVFVMVAWYGVNYGSHVFPNGGQGKRERRRYCEPTNE